MDVFPTHTLLSPLLWRLGKKFDEFHAVTVEFTDAKKEHRDLSLGLFWAWPTMFQVGDLVNLLFIVMQMVKMLLTS